MSAITHSANFMQNVRKCLTCLNDWRAVVTRVLSTCTICDTYSDWSPTNWDGSRLVHTRPNAPVATRPHEKCRARDSMVRQLGAHRLTSTADQDVLLMTVSAGSQLFWIIFTRTLLMTSVMRLQCVPRSHAIRSHRAPSLQCQRSRPSIDMASSPTGRLRALGKLFGGLGHVDLIQERRIDFFLQLGLKLAVHNPAHLAVGRTHRQASTASQPLWARFKSR